MTAPRFTAQGSDDLPHSVSQSTIRVFGVDLVVHHLSNGQRIIEADSMTALFEAMAREDAPEPGDLHRLAELIVAPPSPSVTREGGE